MRPLFTFLNISFRSNQLIKMEETCKKVNVIVKGTAVNAFDNYVLIAFFVSFFLTIIIVLLMVKYISYYMLQEKKRQKERLATQHLPRAPRAQEESDSDSSFEWSDSDSEDVDIEVDVLKSSKKSKGISVKKDVKSTSSSELNLQNDYTHYPLLASIQNRTNSKVSSCYPNISLAASLFPDLFIKGAKSMSLCNLLYFRVNETSWLRKSLVVYHSDFILGLLCDMDMLSEDACIALQEKYEQGIEESQAQLSFAFDRMINTMAIDFESIKIENKPSFKTLTEYFYTLNFDCLKYLLSDISTVEETVFDFENTKISCVLDIQSYYVQLKDRITCLQKNIDINNNNRQQVTSVLKIYRENVFSLLKEFDVIFKADLQDLIKELRKHSSDELDKVLQKHERDFSLLKYEIYKSKENVIAKIIKSFVQYVVLLHKEYLKERNEVLVELNKNEEMQIKVFFRKQFKTIITKISKLEEEVFTSLVDVCNFNEDQIVLLTKDMQDHLKLSRQKCIAIKEQIGKRNIIDTKRSCKISTFMIDYIIKVVSSEFRILKESLITSCSKIPTFNEDIIDDLSFSIQKKFSLVIFDMVEILIKDIFQKVRQIYHPDLERSLNWELDELQEQIKDDRESSFTITEECFNWLSMPDKYIKDFPFDNLISEYKSVIDSVFNTITDLLITEEIEPLQTAETWRHFEKHCEIFKNIKKVLALDKNKENSNEEEKSKTKKYMSRKGSSYKKKTKEEELNEIYSSLIGMKERKLKEISDAIEEKRTLESQQKDKSKGIAGCISVLQKELEFCDDDGDFDLYFKEMFNCEQDYMIRRFNKKLETLLEDDKKEENKDVSVTQRLRKKKKSRNVVSPEHC